MATEFLFIRHGETDFNRQLRFQGHIDVALNATGHEQARRMAAALAAQPFDLLISSDLRRTRETAAPLEGQRNHAALLQPGLREQGFGVLEGLDAHGVQTQHPDLWTKWLRHDADYALPEGESARQFHARVLRTVRELAAAHEGRTLAVVTHGGVLDMLWRTVHGLALTGARQCEIPNTGINRLRWSAGTLHILSWAEAAHLQGLGQQPNTVPLGER